MTGVSGTAHNGCRIRIGLVSKVAKRDDYGHTLTDECVKDETGEYAKYFDPHCKGR